MRKCTILSLISFALIVATSCNENSETIKPQIQELTESVYASANVMPANLYKVFPEAVGTLDEVLVEEGDTVTIGQQLASISSDQPTINAANAKLRKELSEANITSSASAVTRIKQELLTAQEQLKLDSLNYWRQQRLAEKQIGSEMDLENIRLKYQSTQNRVASLKSQLAETERELSSALKVSRNDWNSALARLEDYIIRSKMNGKVYAISCEAGELVSSQQVFALIGERDEFVIELMIDEVDIARVKLDQKVILSLDAFSGQIFEATISKIYPTKEERTQTFRVEATFETKPENLYNGLSGEANIIISEAENVLTIPLEYLSDQGTVKTKSGEEISVETGRENMEMVEILSGLDTNAVLVKPWLMTNYGIILDISRTHLLSRVKQTSIAALGVTFGVGMFITMISFMTGLNGLLDGLILNRTPHIHVYNEIEPSTTQPIELWKEASEFNVVRSIKPKKGQARIHNALPILAQLRKDKRVIGITPQVNVNVFYLAGSIELNGVVTGINALDEVDLFNFGDYIVNGTAQDLIKNDQGILLGAGIAQKMSLKVGDRIQLSSINGGVVPLKIVGFFQSGLANVDKVQSYVNLRTAEQLAGGGSSYISDLNVKLWDMELAPSMSEEISAQHQLTAVDIKTANAQFDTGSDARNLITYVVAITLLTVAGFGIYNILNMLIYEKMNDIAILKATGFSGKDVQYIFISQAMLIGLIGGILGLLLGLVLSVVIDGIPYDTPALPTIDSYPVNYDPIYYIIGIIFAIVSTFLAGYLPSKRAEQIDPVDIIRGQ